MVGSILLDRYRIRDKLGDGGFGIVYRAEDLLLGRDVAVKVLRTDLFQPEARERLAVEARMIALLDHPGIVPIYDFNYHVEPLFLVMPILRGEPLHSLLEKEPLSQGDTLEVGLQVGTALRYSHSKGVLHHDIKPSNILVERSDQKKLHTKLIDFGLASESASDVAPEINGTPGYLSPEQISALPVDERSDLHSLGVLLYECIAGTPAFSGSTLMKLAWNILMTPPEPPHKLGVKIDPSFEELILACLEKKPENRPQNAHELVVNIKSVQRRLSLGTLTSIPCHPLPAAAEQGTKSRTSVLQPVGESLADQLGDLLLVHGNYSDAQAAYLKARDLSRQRGESEPKTEAQYQLKMSQLALRLGEYEEGLTHCRKGLRLVESTERCLTIALRAMSALLYCNMGQTDEAARWIERGFDAYSQPAPSTDIGACIWLFRAQGNLYLSRQQYTKALQAFEEALQLSRGLNDRWERSICYYNMGETLLHLKEYDRACQYLSEARLEKSAIGDRWGLAYVHYALAWMELELLNHDEALLQIRAGLRLAEEIQSPQILAFLRQALDRHSAQSEKVIDDRRKDNEELPPSGKGRQSPSRLPERTLPSLPLPTNRVGRTKLSP